MDRVACPWLIRCFIDPQAVFIFVDERQLLTTAAREKAIPFDPTSHETVMHLCAAPNLLLSSFMQYDTESQNIGANPRLRWTITPATIYSSSGTAVGSALFLIRTKPVSCRKAM